MLTIKCLKMSFQLKLLENYLQARYKQWVKFLIYYLLLGITLQEIIIY